jgi:transmembrane sensor
MENKDQILKWLNGDLTPAELEEFRKTEDYSRYRDIAEGSALLEAPHFDEEANYKELKQKMASQGREAGESYNLSFYLKIAAVFVVIFGGSLFLLHNDPEEFSTGTSEIASFELPDNSSVVLNSDSKISYHPDKWTAERSLHLEGEAFFKVTKGEKFTVKTDKGDVSVLGTEFSVKSRGDSFEVWCYEGAVKISYRQKEVVLREDQSFSGTGDHSSGIVMFDEEIPAWAVQESSFEAAPLRKVIAELERKFEVEIDATNVDLDQLFTGSFTHSDIQIALKAVTIPLNLKFTAESENKIVLYEE